MYKRQADLSAPGDRRRFAYYARHRDLDFEVHRPGQRYDLVVLSARADLSTWRRAPRDGTKIVFDLIDSYLATPRDTTHARLRGLAKFAARELRRPVLDYHGVIEDMCQRADAVVCSTPEQRAGISSLNPNVHVILDIHAEEVTSVKSDFAIGPIVHLVWEGLPYTLDDFDAVAPTLQSIDADQPLALHLVTDLHYGRLVGRHLRAETAKLIRGILPRTYLYQWSEHLLGPIVTACDIAIVPLDVKDPLARAKPENKLLLLWRFGMPVLTSATPAYDRVAGEASVELTCKDPAEWDRKLRAMIADQGLREHSAHAGRRYLADHHDPAQSLARWDALLESLSMVAPRSSNRR